MTRSPLGMHGPILLQGKDWPLRDTAHPSGFGGQPKDMSYTPRVPPCPPPSLLQAAGWLSPPVVSYPSENGHKQHMGVSTALSQRRQKVKGGQSWCSPEILWFFWSIQHFDGKARICDVNCEVPPRPSALRALSHMGSISSGSQKAEYHS